MVASFEPGEGWRWCHTDEALAQPHRKDPGGALRVPHDGGDNTANYPGAFAFSCVADLANSAAMYAGSGAFAG